MRSKGTTSVYGHNLLSDSIENIVRYSDDYSGWNVRTSIDPATIARHVWIMSSITGEENKQVIPLQRSCWPSQILGRYKWRNQRHYWFLIGNRGLILNILKSTTPDVPENHVSGVTEDINFSSEWWRNTTRYRIRNELIWRTLEVKSVMKCSGWGS